MINLTYNVSGLVERGKEFTFKECLHLVIVNYSTYL